jgi:hypothetical protein
VHIKDAAEDVPQTFTKISRNDYDTFPEGMHIPGATTSSLRKY